MGYMSNKLYKSSKLISSKERAALIQKGLDINDPIPLASFRTMTFMIQGNM